MSVKKRSIYIATALTLATIPAMAVEGALGRTIPGAWVQPQGAVVGPMAGFTVTTFPIGYIGAIGGGGQVPEAGALFANVDANISTNWLVPEYVYKTENSKVSLASGAIVVFSWVGVTAQAQFNGAATTFNSANAGLGDCVFMPLTAGIHFSPNNNLAVSTMVFAPTGHFVRGNPTNLGMGEWTVMPNLAHTYLWEKRGLEFDNFVGFDIYSQNAETKYTSGTVFHWDGIIIQYLSKRAGFGVIGSNLTQVTKDRGPVADLLHGFQGGAWGAGPIGFYVAKPEKPGVVIQLRWVNEFEVTNLLKGNMLMLGITLKLN